MLTAAKTRTTETPPHRALALRTPCHGSADCPRQPRCWWEGGAAPQSGPPAQGQAADRESGRRQEQHLTCLLHPWTQKCPPQTNSFATKIWPSGFKRTQHRPGGCGSVGWSVVPRTERPPVRFPVQGARLGWGGSVPSQGGYERQPIDISPTSMFPLFSPPLSFL